MTQLALDWRAARTSDPATSHIAARMVDRPTGQTRVHAAMAGLARPATDHEIAHAAMMALASATKRRGELVDAGLARAVDQLGITPYGRPATRWQLVNAPP